jgi:hypothetical protein
MSKGRRGTEAEGGGMVGGTTKEGMLGGFRPPTTKEGMPERMWERMPERMWERMPERMPEFATQTATKSQRLRAQLHWAGAAAPTDPRP